MGVAVNARFMDRPVTGVERYAGEILRCLGDQVRVARPARPIRGARGHLWEQFILPGRLRPGEILWSPANTGPLRVAHQALTLHDLSWLEHPEWYAPAFALWYRLLLPILAQTVKMLLTPSEYVRQKVMRRFSLPPERVSLAPGGVDMSRFQPLWRPDSRLHSEGGPAAYILFLGSLQPRKNLGLLLQAWDQIRPQFPNLRLVISGTSGAVFRNGALPGRAERVQMLGYVSEADLPTLYARALIFVLPSLDEGFGLPALEAMASGTPVVASRAGALPEVVGDAGLFFDPRDAAGLVGALQRLLRDPKLRRDLGEKGWERARTFSWERSARLVWEAIQACR